MPAIPPPMMTTSNVSCERSMRSRAQFHHLRLRLLQPIRHPHLAVHRRRGGEMLLRLFALAPAPVELAEAEVAVGDEGAYAAQIGERQCLTVGNSSRCQNCRATLNQT